MVRFQKTKEGRGFGEQVEGSYVSNREPSFN